MPVIRRAGSIRPGMVRLGALLRVRHLERLCECSYQKVSVMPLGRGDDEHSAKVGDALNACYSELGGEADADDYRATGIQPPANSSVH